MNALSVKKRGRARELFTGLWHNQHNSEMRLQIDDGGLIRGTFKPGVGAGRHPSKEYSLTGFVCRDVIAFAVAFEEFGCVTSWCGQISSISEDCHTQTIHCLWHMSVDVGNGAEANLWKSILSGADDFVRGARPTEINNLKTACSYPVWVNEQSIIDDTYCCE